MNEAKKPDYKIYIGIPVSAEDGSDGFDFTESKPLKKEKSSDMILSLLSAHTVESAVERKNAFLMLSFLFQTGKRTRKHYLFTFWLEENSVLFKLENEKGTEYREIDNLYYVTELEKIIKTEMEVSIK